MYFSTVLSNIVDSSYLCVISLITTRVYATLFGAETRMAETPPKLTSSRAGYRANLTKTLNKARDFMEKEEPTEMDVVSLNSISEQPAWKKSILQEIDEKIAALLEEPTNEIQDEILELSSQISRFIHLTLSNKKSTQPPSPATHQEFPQAVSNESSLVQSNPSNLSSSGTQELPHPLIKQPRREPHTHKRGKGAVHSNTGGWGGGVQKFSYPKAQLAGDASRVIAGFPFNNINFEQAVKLRKERFGQPSKIISPHCKLSWALKAPSID